MALWASSHPDDFTTTCEVCFLFPDKETRTQKWSGMWAKSFLGGCNPFDPNTCPFWSRSAGPGSAGRVPSALPSPSTVVGDEWDTVRSRCPERSIRSHVTRAVTRCQLPSHTPYSLLRLLAGSRVMAEAGALRGLSLAWLGTGSGLRQGLGVELLLGDGSAMLVTE